MQTLSESEFSRHRESKSKIESSSIVSQLNASHFFKLNLKSQHAGCLLETTLVLHFPAGSSQFLTFSINSTKGRLILKSFLFSLCVDARTFSSPFMCSRCFVNPGYSHFREISCTCCYKHTGLFYIYIYTAYNCQIAQTARHKRTAVILFFLPRYRRIIALSQQK